MDIGTAKPTPTERAAIRHHLIDVVRPTEAFSVAAYQGLAREAIAEIHSRGGLPILVGGSGLYIRAVIDDLRFPAGVKGSQVRLELEERLRAQGPQALHQELADSDPEAAERIPATNPRRVIRALEVMELTGRPFSWFQRRWQDRRSLYELRMFGLTMERPELYAKINERVDRQIAQGLIDEVKNLMAQGYESVLTARQALGYREVVDYLCGRTVLDEAVALIKKRTRHFAKRQMTWFRADPRVRWVAVSGRIGTDIAAGIAEELGRRASSPGDGKTTKAGVEQGRKAGLK